MLIWWPSEQVPGHLPTENLNGAQHDVIAIRVSTSAIASLSKYPPWFLPSPSSSSRRDPRTLDPIPGVTGTDASGNGAPNVTLRLAQGLGKKRHGARRPSGISLSKPIGR